SYWKGKRHMSMTRTAPALKPDEIDHFHRRGYLGPFAVLQPSEMKAIRDQLLNDVFKTPGPNPKQNTHSRHLDTPAVYGVASHPAVVERIAALLGPNVMLW